MASSGQPGPAHGHRRRYDLSRTDSKSSTDGVVDGPRDLALDRPGRSSESASRCNAVPAYSMVSLNRIPDIVRSGRAAGVNRHQPCTRRSLAVTRPLPMSRFARRLPIGAEVQPDGSTHFRVWAPDPGGPTRVEGAAPAGTADDRRDRGLLLDQRRRRRCMATGISSGWMVTLAADPASRFQPEGPFGPSQVVGPRALPGVTTSGRVCRHDRVCLRDARRQRSLPEGTWAAAIDEAAAAWRSRGITMLEVMPVSENSRTVRMGLRRRIPYAPTRCTATRTTSAPSSTRPRARPGRHPRRRLQPLGPDGLCFRASRTTVLHRELRQRMGRAR
jgi:hypothetical protein